MRRGCDPIVHPNSYGEGLRLSLKPNLIVYLSSNEEGLAHDPLFFENVAATRFHTEHLAPGRVVVETSKPQPLSSCVNTDRKQPCSCALASDPMVEGLFLDPIVDLSSYEEGRTSSPVFSGFC